jgi:1,4-dihydroxy-2-naphthoyl-CoA hydrolase
MHEMTTPDQLTALRDTMPFARELRIEVLEASREVVRARLDHRPELCTAGGILHGGALMSLADSCGALCAFLNLPDGAAGTGTIESKTNFLRAVADGAVTAESRPLHAGRTTVVIETTLARADGKFAAKVTQTQAVHYPRT